LRIWSKRSNNLQDLIGAGNNPQAKYDRCCPRCNRRGEQVRDTRFFEKKLRKKLLKKAQPTLLGVQVELF
jgi:hypothetical protein